MRGPLRQVSMTGRQYVEKAHGAINANLLLAPLTSVEISIDDGDCRAAIANSTKTVFLTAASEIGLRRAIENSVSRKAIQSSRRLARFMAK